MSMNVPSLACDILSYPGTALKGAAYLSYNEREIRAVPQIKMDESGMVNRWQEYRRLYIRGIRCIL